MMRDGRAAAPHPHPHQPAVLIVDAHADLCALLCAVLSHEGIWCASAASPAEALPLLRAARYALVVAHSFSPTGADLFTPTAALRAAAAATPVALLTGHPVAAEAARAAGFVGVIAKPFELNDLVARVSDWMLRPT